MSFDFKKWEKEYPELNLLTCWRMAKRNSTTQDEVFSWLRVDHDKLRCMAPKLYDILSEFMHRK